MAAARLADMPPDQWLPCVPRHVDGFRITPIWERRGDTNVFVGMTILADPDSNGHLDRDTFDRLPVWEIVAAGPVPDRLVRAVDAYRQADQAGIPRAKAVAAELGIAEASASNLIVQIRRRRLLPPTRPGVSAA
jgi:hypothetical protein